MPANSSVPFHTPAGTIMGWRDGEVVRATGIRYARAKRFQFPVAEPAAIAPILATSPAPACPQVADPRLALAFGDFYTDATFEEDCLRLSVTLPTDLQPEESLPVIVWVHGGSYVTGAGDVPLYDPVALVSEQRVVFVSVTYRLGLLGFLGSAGGIPPNLGLLDLLEALHWVQRNIAAFGGNPSLVTMLGHSSGADAIAHLMVAKGAAGLFRRVILHSAPLGLAPNRQAMTKAMTTAAGPLHPSAPVEEVLARESVVTKAVRRFGLKSGMPFGTQYGAFPLPTEPEIARVWEAVAPGIDVLIGATAEETRFFAVIDPQFRWVSRVPVMGGLLSRLLVRVTSDLIYVKPLEAFARRHTHAGGRAYRFSVLFRPAGDAFGAGHTVDLPLLLGTPASWGATPLLGKAKWKQVEQAGRQVRQLWADFARTGILPTPVDIPGVLQLKQV
jgi:para-nitrobenzyl esterase